MIAPIVDELAKEYEGKMTAVRHSELRACLVYHAENNKLLHILKCARCSQNLEAHPVVTSLNATRLHQKFGPAQNTK